MATVPRFAIPGTYMISRRTAERRKRLRPDAMINQIILFILGLAVIKYELLLHAYNFLSNHGHLMVTDTVGKRVSRFNQYFFSLTARAINCYRGRKENLWSTGKPNCVFIPALARDLAEKIAYVICNGVLSELVDRANKWPGVKITADQVGRLTITVERPPIFFSRRGKIPLEVTFSVGLPPCQDATEEQLEALVKKRCAEIEAAKRAQMVDEGRPFLGVLKILTSDPELPPETPDPLFKLEPHVACKDPHLRRTILERLVAFRRAYQEALERFNAGQRNTVFPWGTLKMVLDHNCRCRGPDLNPNLGALAL